MKIENKKYLFFSVAIFFLSILLLFLSFLLVSSLILYEQEISADLQVGAIPGFNLDNSILSFGTIAPNISNSRTLQIVNDYPFPILASFSSKGNISKFLIFEKQIKLFSHEEKIVIISTILPREEDYGNYSGKINVILKKEI